MGTRLYPNCVDDVSLELLAGVPAGTTARLAASEAAEAAELAALPKDAHLMDRDEIQYKWFQQREADADLGRLDAFKTYGWGKFRAPQDFPEFWETEEGRTFQSYAGETKSPEAAAAVARLNGISEKDANLAGGFHWS